MRVKSVSLNRTRDYNISESDKPHIQEIREVYFYDPSAHVHCCELTPSFEMHYLYTYIVFNNFVEGASDYLHECMQEKYTLESVDDFYMHCSAAESIKPEDVRESLNEFETLEEAREHLCGNYPF